MPGLGRGAVYKYHIRTRGTDYNVAKAYFDGTHLYEYADPRRGFHPEWKSYIFNLGRHEVQSFLISNALFWLDRYHADGLRVDGVASILYLDYARKAGEWIPNEFGGRENIEAVEFLRRLNTAVYAAHPDVQTIAEESTAWPLVSRQAHVGGLGFGMKWDMGWMHDTLRYMEYDPVQRRYHHHDLTFRAGYGYLRPALDRPNLTVLTDALVHRLIVADDRCAGVEYSAGDEVRQVYPQRETILSAGSIGSAQLLLLSGIGPTDHLHAVGVDVVADLPGVGANLQDHPWAGVTYAAARPVPPAQNNHADLIAAVHSTSDLAAPDIQLSFVDVPYHPPTMPGPANGYTILFAALRPHSRGSVRLASPDPTTAPLIDPNLFGDDRDMVTMLTALGMARELGASPALAKWRDEEALPGPDVHDERELRDYLRHNMGPYWHPVGTCRIGTDPAAVVDPQLRVHGIDGLRVADASVMPSIPGANTNATVLAIAERAATLVGR